jgi:hypothetical protein
MPALSASTGAVVTLGDVPCHGECRTQDWAHVAPKIFALDAESDPEPSNGAQLTPEPAGSDAYGQMRRRFEKLIATGQKV